VTNGPVRRKAAKSGYSGLCANFVVALVLGTLEMFARMHESSTPLFRASNAQVEWLVLLGFD
jgi:hypothetical protein